MAVGLGYRTVSCLSPLAPATKFSADPGAKLHMRRWPDPEDVIDHPDMASEEFAQTWPGMAWHSMAEHGKPAPFRTRSHNPVRQYGLLDSAPCVHQYLYSISRPHIHAASPSFCISIRAGLPAQGRSSSLIGGSDIKTLALSSTSTSRRSSARNAVAHAIKVRTAIQDVIHLSTSNHMAY